LPSDCAGTTQAESTATTGVATLSRNCRSWRGMMKVGNQSVTTIAARAARALRLA
jgi:hypothetical protein